MTYTLNEYGELKLDGLTRTCPWNYKDDVACGDWCALFKMHPVKWEVTLHCASNPLTYEIDDAEVYDGN